MENIVAIVGRPNVGKSTLFNRLTEVRDAIVDESSGVTRDRHYGICEWNGKTFSVIDTGGYVTNSDDVFESEIRKQAYLAIEEASLILFMVDVTTGITDLDMAVAGILRKANKKVLLVVNKVDNHQRLLEANEFYRLGIEELFPVSSINGTGSAELLDKIFASLHFFREEVEEELPRLAVIGRPNVGKSSLINALIEEDRNIVTPISGTTRDSINSRYQKYGKDFILVDTAGLRKKSKVRENVEFYSVMRAVRTVESADVCMLMLDAELGMEAQDVNIFRLVQRNRKGLVILVNKWDLIEKEKNALKQYEWHIKDKIAPFTDIPLVFISVINKQRIHKALQTALEVYDNRQQRIATSTLNKMMEEAIAAYPPPAVKGKYIRIKYVTQLPTNFPAFAFYCNFPALVKAPYKRYLENQIREKFNFTGVPIQIYFRRK